MYTDDTELHYFHSQMQGMEQVLQTEIERVSDWMAVNRLKFNVTKSMYVYADWLVTKGCW